jgi:transposase-like protein
MRRAYSEVDRERLFVEASKSGESLAQCARRQGISVSTAYAWASARKAVGGVTFAQVVPQSEAFEEARASGLTLRLGQLEIDVHEGFDAALLRAVVEALTEGKQ